MKISDLPKKSKARIELGHLDAGRQRERLRCAQAALDQAIFCWDKYRRDEPAQWIRCENILREILKDPQAKITWFIGVE